MVRVRTPSGGVAGSAAMARPIGWCAGSDAPRQAGVYRRVAGPPPADGPRCAADGLCSAVVRNPFGSPLWRNHGVRPRLDGGDRSPSSGRSSRGSRCRSWRSSSSAPGRSRSRSCAASTSARRSSFGLVAGAWVDRLRRRPVLIWADLGRAVLLGSIPVAFALGVLSFCAAPRRVRPGRDPDDLLRCRRQRLPADDRRARAAGRGQQRPGGERLGGRVHGLRHQRLPRPDPDRADRHRRRRGHATSSRRCCSARSGRGGAAAAAARTASRS